MVFWKFLQTGLHQFPGLASKMFQHASTIGFSSHLARGLVHPGYRWINPTYPMQITGVITHLLSGMNHQVWCVQVSRTEPWGLLQCWLLPWGRRTGTMGALSGICLGTIGLAHAASKKKLKENRASTPWHCGPWPKHRSSDSRGI